MVLLVVIGRRWSSLVVIGRRWSSLVVVGRRWLSLVVVGRRWLSLVVVGLSNSIVKRFKNVSKNTFQEKTPVV